MNDATIARYVAYFEHMEPASLAAIDDYFSADARFADPFNDVTGPAAIRRVLEHMFTTCEAPRFVVDEWVGDASACYLRWQFSFGAAKGRRVIHGVSRVQFGADGRALEHIDYWDPAGQLYETLPLLGRVFRALRGHLGARQPGADARPTKPSDNNDFTQRNWR